MLAQTMFAKLYLHNPNVFLEINIIGKVSQDNRGYILKIYM